MDKNKLPYVSPEVETVGIIPESSVLTGSGSGSGSGTTENPGIDNSWDF